MSKYNQRNRERARAKGLCINCLSRMAKPERVRCGPCLRKQRQAAAEKRHAS